MDTTVLINSGYEVYDWDINYPNLNNVLFYYRDTCNLTGIANGIEKELYEDPNYFFTTHVIINDVMKTVIVLKKEYQEPWAKKEQNIEGEIVRRNKPEFDDIYTFEKLYQ